MQAQYLNNAMRLLVVGLLPLFVMAACDSLGENPGTPVPQARRATVSFDATVEWPSYGEEIRAIGTRSLRYQSAATGSGDYEVLVQPETIEADFTGLDSGDSYDYHFMDAVRELAVFGGPVGAEEYLSETILLTNERTEAKSEGVIVTKATIGARGNVSFKVIEIVALP